MDVLKLFRGWKQVESHEPGTVVFSEGDPAKTLYVVLAGSVELTVRGEAIGEESSGGIIGEMVMLESAQSTATATAATSTRLALVGPEDARRMLACNPEFSMQLMSALTNRLRALDNIVSGRDAGKAAGGDAQ